MIKPDNCNWCQSEDLILEENKEIFNPDTDKYDIYEKAYICRECETIHVNNNEVSFIQRDIDTNKLLQTTETNISIN